MNEQVLQDYLMELIRQWGDIGVFIAMFLESSVVPVPSEVIIIGAGAAGVPMAALLIFGSLGATCGAIVGYSIGRYAAMPVIVKFGKYIFITPEHITKAEAFARRYGAWGVLAGRLLPIVPFKVFSIASGLTHVPFIPFILCTMLGVVPRIYVLALLGTLAIQYAKIAAIVLGVVLLCWLVIHLWQKRHMPTP